MSALSDNEGKDTDEMCAVRQREEGQNLCHLIILENLALVVFDSRANLVPINFSGVATTEKNPYQMIEIDQRNAENEGLAGRGNDE